MGHKGKWEYKIWNSVSQGTMQQRFLMEIFCFLVEIFWYLSFSQNLEIFSLKTRVENYLLFSLKFCPGKIKHFPTIFAEDHRNQSLLFFLPFNQLLENWDVCYRQGKTLKGIINQRGLFVCLFFRAVLDLCQWNIESFKCAFKIWNLHQHLQRFAPSILHMLPFARSLRQNTYNTSA